MDDKQKEEILKEQLVLLAERSKHCEDSSLADITLAMLEVCRYSDPI